MCKYCYEMNGLLNNDNNALFNIESLKKENKYYNDSINILSKKNIDINNTKLYCIKLLNYIQNNLIINKNDDKNIYSKYITKNLNNNLIEFNCQNCKDIINLPKLLPKVFYLNFSNTGVLKIPKTYNMLVFLDCSNTNINNLPDTLYNLQFLNLSNTNVSKLPKTYTNLISLNIKNTQIEELPNNLLKLKKLYCDLLPHKSYLNPLYKQLLYFLPKYKFLKNIPNTYINLIKINDNCNDYNCCFNIYNDYYKYNKNLLNFKTLYNEENNNMRKIYNLNDDNSLNDDMNIYDITDLDLFLDYKLKSKSINNDYNSDIDELDSLDDINDKCDIENIDNDCNMNDYRSIENTSFNSNDSGDVSNYNNDINSNYDYDDDRSDIDSDSIDNSNQIILNDSFFDFSEIFHNKYNKSLNIYIYNKLINYKSLNISFNKFVKLYKKYKMNKNSK